MYVYSKDSINWAGLDENILQTMAAWSLELVVFNWMGAESIDYKV